MAWERGPGTSGGWAGGPLGGVCLALLGGAPLPPFPERSYQWCGQGQSLQSQPHPALGGKAAELWS